MSATSPRRSPWPRSIRKRYGGKTYEIGGPQVMSMVELHQAIFAITGQTPDIVELPDFVGSLLSKLGWLPGAPLTRDQWLMLQRDNVAVGRAARPRGIRDPARRRSPPSATNGSAASRAASSPAGEFI